jgi:hypothetical protein
LHFGVAGATTPEAAEAPASGVALPPLDNGRSVARSFALAAAVVEVSEEDAPGDGAEVGEVDVVADGEADEGE